MADQADLDDLPLRQRVGTLIRAVMVLRGRRAVDLCPVLSLSSESSVSERLNGHIGLRSEELQAIADYLDTAVSVFFLTVDEALDALRSRCLTLEAVASPPVVQPEMFPERPRIAILSDAS